MKRVQILLGMAMLAASTNAQTQKLTVTDAGVSVQVGTRSPVAKTLPAGDLAQPGTLTASDQGLGFKAFQNLYAWTSGPGLQDPRRLGGYLHNQATVNITDNSLVPGLAFSLGAGASAGPQTLSWTYIPASDFTGKILVDFKGALTGSGLSVSVKAGPKGTTPWSTTVATAGTFAQGTEFANLALKANQPFVFEFSMDASIKLASAGRSNLTAALSFHLECAPAAKTLAWKTSGTACGGLTIGAAPLPPLFGTPLDITLAGAPANSWAFLLMGGRGWKWSLLSLPLDLTPFGAPGCTLYTPPVIGFAVKTDGTGSAKATLQLPSPAGLGLNFPGLDMQYACTGAPNSLGMYYSDLGSILLQ